MGDHRVGDGLRSSPPVGAGHCRDSWPPHCRHPPLDLIFAGHRHAASPGRPSRGSGTTSRTAKLPGRHTRRRVRPGRAECPHPRRCTDAGDATGALCRPTADRLLAPVRGLKGALAAIESPTGAPVLHQQVGGRATPLHRRDLRPGCPHSRHQPLRPRASGRRGRHRPLVVRGGDPRPLAARTCRSTLGLLGLARNSRGAGERHPGCHGHRRADAHTGGRRRLRRARRRSQRRNKRRGRTAPRRRGAMTGTERARGIVTVLGWAALLIGAIVVLGAMGRGGLSTPPVGGGLGAVQSWASTRDAATILMTGMRVGGTSARGLSPGLDRARHRRADDPLGGGRQPRRRDRAAADPATGHGCRRPGGRRRTHQWRRGTIRAHSCPPQSGCRGARPHLHTAGSLRRHGTARSVGRRRHPGRRLRTSGVCGRHHRISRARGRWPNLVAIRTTGPRTVRRGRSADARAAAVGVRRPDAGDMDGSARRQPVGSEPVSPSLEVGSGTDGRGDRSLLDRRRGD